MVTLRIATTAIHRSAHVDLAEKSARHADPTAGLIFSISRQPYSHKCASAGGRTHARRLVCVTQRQGTHTGSRGTFAKGYFAGGRTPFDHDRTNSATRG